MFKRLKSAVTGAVEGLDGPRSLRPSNSLPPKHKYSRPAFLNLSEDAIAVSIDKKVRPVLSVSSSSPLPHHAGYAECVNAGKSVLNEDMAQVHHDRLKYKVNGKEEVITYTYFGIFDGHAGCGAALDASKHLHHIIHQKLVNSMDAIISLSKDPPSNSPISKRDLIIGCLEVSFCEMDEVINETRLNYDNPGGCTAIVALFILGDIYVANAGDSRSGICDNGQFIPMSNDFSPSFDRHRIYTKALENPHILGGIYTTREFLEFPSSDDLGKPILFKDPFMSGWAYKTLVSEDIKLPLIIGNGRRSRIMGTIGVARGFGDFDLISIHYKTPIKPLLTCVPEIKVFSIKDIVDKSAVLIMASDGLWDAVECDDVINMCADAKLQNINDKNKYVSIAMNLIAAARGRKDSDNSIWLLKNQNSASFDDISVFVIPIEPFGETKVELDVENGCESSTSESGKSSTKSSDTEEATGTVGEMCP